LSTSDHASQRRLEDERSGWRERGEKKKRYREGRGGGPGSDETSSSALRVDLLETLDFQPLLDHTHRGEQETYDYGHETVNSGKNVVQRGICKGRDRRDAIDGSVLLSERSGLTKSATNFAVGAIKVPTAMQLIL